MEEEVLTEEFYKKFKKNFDNYVNNYDMMDALAKKMEMSERERLMNAEEEYHILEKFGVIL